MASKISKNKTTIQLMIALDKLYEKPSTNKLFLMICLFNMKMVDGGSFAYNVNEFNTTTSQLNFVNVNFNDGVRALLILCSFLES